MLGFRRFGWVMVLGCGLAGCSGDFAGFGGDENTGDTDSGVDSGPLTAGDEADTGGSTPDPDASGGADGGSTGDGPGEATGADEPCGLECPNGWCDLDEEGQPACFCEDGYASNGLGCIPCEPAGTSEIINVPVSLVSLRVTINDAPPPNSPYENAEISLRNIHTDDVIVLGQTRQEGFTVPLVPGRYEVFYSVLQGGDFVPANTQARLGTVVLEDVAGSETVIDIPVATISGDFTFASTPAPDSPYENGEVFLRNRLTGDEVLLGQTRDGSYIKVVLPGEYDVRYRWLAGDELAPINGDAQVGSIIVEENAGEVIPEFDIDIPTVAASGTITLDGSAPPDSPYENGRILLRDSVTGDEFPVGHTRDGQWSAILVDGSYDVFYTRLAGTAVVPANSHAKLRTLDTKSGDFELALTTATISGDITVGGAPAPADNSDDGILRLGAPDGDDVVVLGNTHDQSYSAVVLEGTYDIYYSQETSSGGVPANTNARLQENVLMAGNAMLPIDIDAVPLSGSFTLDGAPPPISEYDDGRIYLRNALTGDSVLLGNTRFQAYDRLVVPGTYDVVYVVETAGAEVPTNAEAIIGSVQVDGKAFDIDVPVGRIDGDILVDGAAPPPGDIDWGDLFLQDLQTGDTIFLAKTLNPVFSEALTAGNYFVLYRSRAFSTKAPANSNAAIACLEITGQ